MASVSLRVSALCGKIRGLSKRGTDKTLQRVSMACIFIAIHDLGNAAMPSSRSTRTGRKKPIDVSEFLFVAPLGQGYRGCIAKVRHPATGKTFALKHYNTLLHQESDDPLPHQGLNEEEEVTILRNLAILREACLMAACRGHPSLVRLHGVCEHPEKGWYYLAMEHVGPSLYKVLHERRGGDPFPEHEVRRMIRQILRGAKAMHDRGIFHRNINPENVLMDIGRDIVKITGFGEAVCTSEAEVRVRCIEVWYSAPEMLLAGRDAFGSELVDSWSIGCLMAELLTGRVLFEVNDRGNTAEPHLHRIFDVLGIPGKRAMQAMKPQDLELAQEVRKWRARRGVGKLRSDNRLRKLVPHELLSDEGFQVLQGLLTCNPKNRLTAGAALQLPWFADDVNSPATDLATEVV